MIPGSFPRSRRVVIPLFVVIAAATVVRSAQDPQDPSTAPWYTWIPMVRSSRQLENQNYPTPKGVGFSHLPGWNKFPHRSCCQVWDWWIQFLISECFQLTIHNAWDADDFKLEAIMSRPNGEKSWKKEHATQFITTAYLHQTYDEQKMKIFGGYKVRVTFDQDKTLDKMRNAWQSIHVEYIFNELEKNWVQPEASELEYMYERKLNPVLKLRHGKCRLAQINKNEMGQTMSYNIEWIGEVDLPSENIQLENFLIARRMIFKTNCIFGKSNCRTRKDLEGATDISRTNLAQRQSISWMTTQAKASAHRELRNSMLWRNAPVEKPPQVIEPPNGGFEPVQHCGEETNPHRYWSLLEGHDPWRIIFGQESDCYPSLRSQETPKSAKARKTNSAVRRRHYYDVRPVKNKNVRSGMDRQYFSEDDESQKTPLLGKNKKHNENEKSNTNSESVPLLQVDDDGRYNYNTLG